MTEEEIELIVSRIRNSMSKRIEFCDNVGITLDDYYIKSCGDFEIKDMVRAFENGKLFYEEIINDFGETKEQLTKAKEIIKEYTELKYKPCAVGNSINMLLYDNICAEAEQFLNSEVKK